MRRTSPGGSPSQMRATRSPLPARTCRSRQFTEALSLPPRNHFACGGFHSRTRSHGRLHSSCFAQSAQYPSGSRWARSYGVTSRTCAWALKLSGGGKRRCSSSSVSIRSVAMVGDIKEEEDSSKLHHAARIAAGNEGERAHLFVPNN